MEWQPHQVKAELQPLTWQVDASMSSPACLAYCDYYGLKFEGDLHHVRHEMGYFDAHGFRLAAHVFHVPDAQGTVLLQHGYYDHVGLYGHMIRHCLRQGFNVFAYDLPGHGLSTGDRAAITSFQQYDQVFEDGLKLLSAQITGPIVAMGQSTGGAIIINYLLSRHINRDTSPFSDIVLLAPLVRPVGWRWALLAYHLLNPFIKQMKRTFTENSNNAQFVEFITRHDPLQPKQLNVAWVRALKQWIEFIESCPSVDLDIRVIQGDEDGTVDYRHNIKVLAEKFLGSEVIYIPGARHHLVNEDEQTLAQIYTALTPLAQR